MNRTQELRFELESQLEDKIIFKKEWLEDMTEEQEECFDELYEVIIEGRNFPFRAKIIALEGKYFEVVDYEDVKSYFVEVSEVDLETIEWFIEQETIKN